jgi:uncharacterized membrane protein (UPF0127 family)
MPKASVANATVSAPKTPQRHYIFSILCGLLVSLLALGVLAWHRNASCPLQLTTGCMQLEFARNDQQRSLGLGNRTILPLDKGMVFVLPKGDPGCFWMKDMHFDLDMIWLNGDKQITKIQPNVSPGTYPQTYCSPQPATYVLEVNAGLAAKNNLQVNQTLNF